METKKTKKPVLAKKYREPDNSGVPRATRRKIDKYERTAVSRFKARDEEREKKAQKDARQLTLKKRNDANRKRSEARLKWKKKIGTKIGVSYKRIVLTSALSGRKQPEYSVKPSKR